MLVASNGLMSTTPSRVEFGAEALWRAHTPRLLEYATYLVGPSDAHDIVVDAFLKVVPRVLAGEVDHPGSYLLRAVRNQATSARRSRQRRWRRDLAGVGPSAVSAPDGHGEVRSAIAELSVAQRSVIYLVYWEDLSEADAARELGISPSTVHRHLGRARNRLRKALR